MPRGEHAATDCFKNCAARPSLGLCRLSGCHAWCPNTTSHHPHGLHQFLCLRVLTLARLVIIGVGKVAHNHNGVRVAGRQLVQRGSRVGGLGMGGWEVAC